MDVFLIIYLRNHFKNVSKICRLKLDKQPCAQVSPEKVDTFPIMTKKDTKIQAHIRNDLRYYQ